MGCAAVRDRGARAHRLLVAALCACVFGGARAEARPDSEAGARDHYLAGEKLYEEGDYRGAINEFRTGYRLLPLPRFQFNLARAFEKLDDLPAARASYERFLAEAPADDPFRGRARAALADVVQRIHAAEPGGERPKAEPAPSSQEGRPPPTVAAAPAVGPAAVAAPSPPPRPGGRRYLRWLIPLVVVAVVGAAAVTTGVLVSQSQKDSCASASLGCLSFGK
jgi:tetratricopeptide (TPR) repeat protein